MKWYSGIIAWIADAIKRKAELNEDDSVDARLGKIEEKLKRIDKSNLPVAVFASGLPIYLIGLAGSWKNSMEVTGIEWENRIYLVVGSLLVILAMIGLKERKRNIFITIAITFGGLIVITIINWITVSS